MDTLEQINSYKEFIEGIYLDILLENSRKGLQHIRIDFQEISKFNVTLAEILLEQPEDAIQTIKLAIQNIDLPNEDIEFDIQIYNLPENSKKLIAHKRSSDLDRMLSFEGIIRAKSEVLSRIVSMKFECPSCGNIIPVIQNDETKKEPTRCGCGRKGKFREIAEETKKIDIQRVELEELSENVKGTSQPQRLKVLLKRSLVDPEFEARFNPGAKIEVSGIMKDIPVIKRNRKTVDSDFLLEAVNMENIDNEEIDLNITDAEMKRINEIAKNDQCIKILKNALIPSIHGHDEIKEGILVQLAGGVRKVLDDGTVKRGDIHILIIGDPGSGKSAMLQRIEKVIPSARVANGKGASGVGLTASIVKDDYVGWTFVAGTLVLAHKNIAIIDEFDKMTKEDRDQIHEALEQQTVTVTKASVQARLNCECSLLAGANPKTGRFDPYNNSLIDEIDLPPTIINRFDLIFPVKDIPNLDKDELVGMTILDSHSKECAKCKELDTPLLRKYLYLAKQRKPILPDLTKKRLLKYYLTIRNMSGNEKGVKSVPISARQLEGLVRMSQAYAKLRLSSEVSVEDAENAINLLDSCLRKIAIDPETGQLDMDKIHSGVTQSQRSNLVKIKEILNELEAEGIKSVPMETLIERAAGKGIDEKGVDKAINYLKKKGDVFLPRRGYIQKL